MRCGSRHSCRSNAVRTASARAGLKIVLMLSGVGFGAATTFSPAPAQDSAAEVAYVEAVKGRVVALSRAAPVLVDTLDIISDRTRLDLQANSELSICHYRTNRFLIMRGPARVSVSAAGATHENGKPVETSPGTCAVPVVWSFPGGVIARGGVLKTTNVPLQPSIKVVNRGTVPINRIALWDSDQQTIVGIFERHAARPTFDEGRSYLLVIERSDGSELRMILKGNSTTRSAPVFRRRPINTPKSGRPSGRYRCAEGRPERLPRSHTSLPGSRSPALSSLHQ